MARLSLVAVVFCLLLAGGCASRQGGDSGQGLSMSVPDEDTSPPLTATETAALQTSGQVDRNIPESAMPDVTRQYKYFLRKGRPTMSASSKRAEQFLAYAKRVFRSRGMPEDLAYLAIVESGYRAEVRSPAGAAGAGHGARLRVARRDHRAAGDAAQDAQDELPDRVLGDGRGERRGVRGVQLGGHARARVIPADPACGRRRAGVGGTA